MTERDEIGKERKKEKWRLEIGRREITMTERDGIGWRE